jgi:polyhydroxybutyrate depolymerase
VLSATETLQKWVTFNGCEGEPAVKEADRAPEDGTRVRSEAYSPCREGSEVVFQAIEGGGHTWPGGSRYLPAAIVGPVSQELDASRALWAFFQRFQLP